ncbi:hypothetical protein K440DRAFT_664064 [Wilcoxina mikolae CBS 423.85]|nr:hypothetical protein K440DRAFT_664064 [Wilcoxina mikolae CBS 423.85]
MVNEGYNSAGTVHSNWDVPIQLAYPEHSLGHLPYPDQTANYHNQEHLQSTSEENCSFYPIGWQAPSYNNMAPEIASGQHISESLFGNTSAEGSSGLTTVQEPLELLRCTYQPCTAKEEDKIFIGKGAKSAHKRHMDGHTKPHTCPHVECPRHIRGFARRDNYNNHLKTHDNKKKKRRRNPASGHSNLLGVLGGGTSAGRRGLQRMTPRQRGRLVNVLLMCVELGFEMEEDEDDDDGSDGEEETEEDDAE